MLDFNTNSSMGAAPPLKPLQVAQDKKIGKKYSNEEFES